MRSVFGWLVAMVIAWAPPTAGAQALPPTLQSAGVTVVQWEDLLRRVEQQARARQISERALLSATTRLGEILAQNGGPVLDTLSVQIETLGSRLSLLEQRLATIQSDENPQISALVATATQSLSMGDLDAADRALANARSLRAERLAARRVQMDTELTAQANVIATQGEISLLRSDWAAAATFYDEAATTTPTAAWRERWVYRLAQAEALSLNARLGGVDASLAEALRIYETEVIPHTARDADLTDWALVLNNSNVVRALVTPRNSAELRTAISGLESALAALPPDASPFLEFIVTINLANAHLRLGKTAADGSAIDRANELYARVLDRTPAGQDAALGKWAYLNAGDALSGLRNESERARALATFELASTALGGAAPYVRAMAEMNFARLLEGQALGSGNREDFQAALTSLHLLRSRLNCASSESCGEINERISRLETALAALSP